MPILEPPGGGDPDGLLSGSAGIVVAVLAGVSFGLDGMALAWLTTQLATGG